MQPQSPQQAVAGPSLRRFAATLRPVLQALDYFKHPARNNND